MKKQLLMVCSVGFACSILFAASLLILPSELRAQPKVIDLEGVSYNVNSSMEDNVKALIDKKVYVTLDSGKTISGFVKAVGNHLLHLEKIDGKDYFDALIRIENIGAIDTRFRDLQR